MVHRILKILQLKTNDSENAATLEITMQRPRFLLEAAYTSLLLPGDGLVAQCTYISHSIIYDYSQCCATPQVHYLEPQCKQPRHALEDVFRAELH